SFHGNRAYLHAGGMEIGIGEVRNCLFEENRAVLYYGGGLFVDGYASVHDCVFRADSCAWFGCGAVKHGMRGFNRCLFERNYAGLDGGGLWVFGNLPTDSCRFVGNTAGRNGGGYGLDATSVLPPAPVRSCSFSGNRALDGGGVATTRDGTVRLENCL